MLAYQDQHRSTCVASKLCKLENNIFIVLMGKVDISFGLVSPVSVLLRPTGVVCIIILNYARSVTNLSSRNCCTVGGHLSPRVRDHHEGGDHSPSWGNKQYDRTWQPHSANITTGPLSQILLLSAQPQKPRSNSATALGSVRWEMRGGGGDWWGEYEL